MQSIYHFIEDPGHGWLAVPLSELRALGIADKITRYSYIDRKANPNESVVWLEEDCDIATFALARWPSDDPKASYAAMHQVMRRQYVGHTHIRNLPSFSP